MLVFREGPVVTGTALCDHFHMTRTVLIVDDHPAFRASARTMLEDEGFEVVAEAENGRTAIELARELEPEVVLLDIALPDLSGLDVAEQLQDAASKVVLTSSRRRSDFGARLRRSSALGFIAKDELSAETLVELLDRQP
jgi:DNA-binding NarL/FixJ family response regulator